MDKFVLKEIATNNITRELTTIGFDSSYSEQASLKYKYKNIKIYSLTSAQANILKQLALSVGADCATHRDVITANIENSDVILGGSISQLKKIAEKLKYQPFSLKELSDSIFNQIEVKKSKTKLVGILNITEDSFSDGGKYLDQDIAYKHLQQMISDGADIIDIGAESTRPNAEPVSDEIQLKRLLPIIEKAKGVILSVDTRSARVAEECLKRGAKIINDVSGLQHDSDMTDIVAKYNATVVVQHSKNIINQGTNVEQTDSIIDDVYLDLYNKTEYAKSRGINNIIIDVGIGFDKTEKDNFELVKRISEFKSMGYPIMLGVSRKSFLNTTSYKDEFTLAINTIAIENGIDYLRVHNIKLHKDFINCYNKC